MSEWELEKAVDHLMRKFHADTRARLIAAGLVRGFINEASIVRSLQSSKATKRITRGGLAKWQLKRAAEYMVEYIEQNLVLNEVAASVNLSTFHFARAFKQMTGLPPRAWLTALRMETAQDLMRSCPTMSLTEVAISVGYQSQTAFGTAFKRHCGASPRDWRRNSVETESIRILDRRQWSRIQGRREPSLA